VQAVLLTAAAIEAHGLVVMGRRHQ
jgi:hypothetical protein